jgi:hypothetical protein
MRRSQARSSACADCTRASRLRWFAIAASLVDCCPAGPRLDVDAIENAIIRKLATLLLEFGDVSGREPKQHHCQQ